MSQVLARLLGIALVLAVQSGRGEAAVTWRELPPLPEPRLFHAAGVGADGRLYAVGGHVHGPEHSGWFAQGVYAAAAYDPRENRWERVPEPRWPEHQRLQISSGRGGTLREGRFPRYERRPARVVGDRFPYEFASGNPVALGKLYWFYHGWAMIFDPVRREWDADGLETDPHYREASARLPLWAPAMERHLAVLAPDREGRIYVLGGRVSRRLEWRRVPVDSGARSSPSTSVEVYDSVRRRWERREPMRQARQLFAATFASDGKLYVFGGYGGVGSMSVPADPDPQFEYEYERQQALAVESLRTVEVYDPASDTWEVRSSMPVGLHNFGAALGADGRIYVVGGARSFSDPRPEKQVRIYDPRRDTWTEGPSLTTARYGHAAVATPEGQIYVLGGMGRAGFLGGGLMYLGSVEMLDTSQVQLPEGEPAGRGHPPDPLQRLESNLSHLSSDDWHVRRAAAAEVARLVGPRDREAVSVLIRALRDSDAKVRASSAEALRRIGSAAESSADALYLLLEDDLRDARWAAVDALLVVTRDHSQLIPHLVRLLDEEDLDDRVRVGEALARIGAEVIPALRADLKRKDIRFPRGPITVLGDLGAPAIPALVELLRNDRAEVRAAAAYELGELGGTAGGAIGALVQLLDDEDSTVRVRAGMALGRIGPTARAQVLAALGDDRWDVRATAAWALGEMGDGHEDVVPRLQALLPMPEEGAKEKLDGEQLAACQALERLGTNPRVPCQIPERRPAGGVRLLPK